MRCLKQAQLDSAEGTGSFRVSHSGFAESHALWSNARQNLEVHGLVTLIRLCSFSMLATIGWLGGLWRIMHESGLAVTM